MNRYHHFSLAERYCIGAHIQKRFSISQIAGILGRDPVSLRREISRNSIDGFYDYNLAHAAAQRRRLRAATKIKDGILEFLRVQLRHDHSPEQICLRLWRQHRISLSIGAVYAFIWRDYEQGGQLWRKLRYCGRGGRGKRLRRYGSGQRLVQRRRRQTRRSIHERPPHIDHRFEYGHWEMDLIEGKGRKRFLLVLVERKSRYVCAGLLSEKRAGSVAQVAKRLLQDLKVRSVTTDNGVEFNQEQLIEEALGSPLYFTDPYKSWQKGLVENTNGLLRQYFPKDHSLCGANMAAKLARALHRLNTRVRKCLDGFEPAELLPLLTVS